MLLFLYYTQRGENKNLGIYPKNDINEKRKLFPISEKLPKLLFLVTMELQLPQTSPLQLACTYQPLIQYPLSHDSGEKQDLELVHEVVVLAVYPICLVFLLQFRHLATHTYFMMVGAPRSYVVTIASFQQAKSTGKPEGGGGW